MHGTEAKQIIDILIKKSKAEHADLHEKLNAYRNTLIAYLMDKK